MNDAQIPTCSTSSASSVSEREKKKPCTSTTLSKLKEDCPTRNQEESSHAAMVVAQWSQVSLFMTLPIEVRSKIFSNFNTTREFLIARLVANSGWNTLIRSTPYFSNITSFTLDFDPVCVTCMVLRPYRVIGNSEFMWKHLILKNFEPNVLTVLRKKCKITQEKYPKVLILRLEFGHLGWPTMLNLINKFPNLEELAIIQCDLSIEDVEANEDPMLEYSDKCLVMHHRNRKNGTKFTTVDFRPILSQLKVLELEFEYIEELSMVMSYFEGTITSLTKLHVRFNPKFEIRSVDGNGLYTDVFDTLTSFIISNDKTLKTLGVNFTNVSNWASFNSQLRIKELLSNKRLMNGIESFGPLGPNTREIPQIYHKMYLDCVRQEVGNSDYDILRFALELKNMKYFNYMVKLYHTCSASYMNLIKTLELNRKIRYLYANLGCYLDDILMFEHVEHLELYGAFCRPYTFNENQNLDTFYEHLVHLFATFFLKLKVLHVIKPELCRHTQHPRLVVDDLMHLFAQTYHDLVCLYLDFCEYLTSASFICSHVAHGNDGFCNESCKRLCDLPNLEELRLLTLQHITDKAIIHGLKFPKLKKLKVTGMPMIKDEVIMTIAENNRGLEMCTLEWIGVGQKLNRRQWAALRKEFRKKLIYIQERKLKFTRIQDV